MLLRLALRTLLPLALCQTGPAPTWDPNRPAVPELAQYRMPAPTYRASFGAGAPFDQPAALQRDPAAEPAPAPPPPLPMPPPFLPTSTAPPEPQAAPEPAPSTAAPAPEPTTPPPAEPSTEEAQAAPEPATVPAPAPPPEVVVLTPPPPPPAPEPPQFSAPEPVQQVPEPAEAPAVQAEAGARFSDYTSTGRCPIPCRVPIFMFSPARQSRLRGTE